ncbi:MAG: hypothetical protein K1X72_18810 [Pyrinomonadaceae bacterium]|nr:hypothetical protein [Pyrinomonadaceae bacterium]
MLKRNLLTLLLPFFLLVLCVNAQTDGIDKSVLTQIKRIYVAEDTSVLPVTKGLAKDLKIELEKKGFLISDTKKDADAILLSEISAEITLDGDASDPNNSIYYCKILAKSDKLIWKTTIKFRSKTNWAEDNRIAAKKIAEKLYKDWQKSAKKDVTKQLKLTD